MTKPEARTTIPRSRFGLVRYLHRERAAAAARALRLGIRDAEAAAVQIVVEINHGAVEVHQAALVHDHRDAVKLEGFIKLLVQDGVEIKLVLEAAATTTHDAHA